MASKQAGCTLDQQVSDYLLTAGGHLTEGKSRIDMRQAAAYGAAASSALVMMSQAEASVVYDAPPSTPRPVTVTAPFTGTSSVNFDIDGDATDDFALFGALSTSTYFGSTTSTYTYNGRTYSNYFPYTNTYSNFSAGINATAGNEVMGELGVQKLNNGDSIGPSGSWNNGKRDVFFNSGNGTSGWTGNNGETGFAGVRFKIGGNTHYGWIKLQLNAAGSLTATDWAYESCPDMPIQAGATSGGAICGTPAAIPAMGLPALGLMGLALGGIGLAGLRRRRQEIGKPA